MIDSGLKARRGARIFDYFSGLFYHCGYGKKRNCAIGIPGGFFDQPDRIRARAPAAGFD
jgi:hypothetical protein